MRPSKLGRRCLGFAAATSCRQSREEEERRLGLGPHDRGVSEAACFCQATGNLAKPRNHERWELRGDLEDACGGRDEDGESKHRDHHHQGAAHESRDCQSAGQERAQCCHAATRLRRFRWIWCIARGGDRTVVSVHCQAVGGRVHPQVTIKKASEDAPGHTAGSRCW